MAKVNLTDQSQSGAAYFSVAVTAVGDFVSGFRHVDARSRPCRRAYQATWPWLARIDVTSVNQTQPIECGNITSSFYDVRKELKQPG